MERIKQHKLFIVAFLGGMLFICLFCFASFLALGAINTANKTLATPQTIITPVVAIDDVKEYRAHVIDWTKRTTRITDVLYSILNGDKVDPTVAKQAGADLGRLRSELHETIPPPVYATFHLHYTNAIDALYDGVILLSRGNVTLATKKFEYGKQEMDKAVDSIPHEQPDLSGIAAIEIPTIAATPTLRPTFTATLIPTNTSTSTATSTATATQTTIPTLTNTLIPTNKPTSKPVIVATAKPKPKPKPTEVSSNVIVCNDGTISHARHRQGACSHHGGIRK